MYSAIKHLHILTVLISINLFLLRGWWRVSAPERLNANWIRIAPHLNDTILLTAALLMLWIGSINPLNNPWLLGKIALLFVYIGLGSIALKRRNTLAFIAALACFAWIVVMAISKQVWPF